MNKVKHEHLETLPNRHETAFVLVCPGLILQSCVLGFVLLIVAQQGFLICYAALSQLPLHAAVHLALTEQLKPVFAYVICKLERKMYQIT